MRETFFLPGKRHKHESLDEVHRIVKGHYPGALREDYVAHYHWYLKTDVDPLHNPRAEHPIVAEAWMSNDMRWWYYKIDETMKSVPGISMEFERKKRGDEV